MSKRLVPFVVFGIFLVYLAASAVRVPTGSAGAYDLAGLRRLPVSVNGRVQPFDSAARIALQRIRGSAFVPPDQAAPGQSRSSALDANAWLIEVLAKPDAADTRRIFPIGERELRAKLSLGSTGDGVRYYAFRDLGPKVSDIGRQTERIAKMKEADRAPWEAELLVLRTKLVAYERLKNSVQPNSLLQLETRGHAVAFDFAGELARYRSDLGEAVRVAGRRRNGGKEELDPATEQRVRTFARRFEHVSRIGLVAMVPPPQPADARARWGTTGAAIVSSSRNGRLAPPVAYVAEIVSAFAQGKAAAFNASLVRYQRWLASNGLEREANHVGYEAFYNVFQPFAKAVAVYVVGLTLLFLAWRTHSTTVRRSAQALVLLAFGLHTVGLAFTFVLAGRPSAITFVAWTAALVAFGLALWRRGPGLAAGAAVGLTGIGAAYAFGAGGASALVRTVPETGLLAAVVASALALGAAGVAARPALWRRGVGLAAPAGTHSSRPTLAAR